VTRRIVIALLSTAAAYTPIPKIELSDNGPGQAPAITSSLTQPSGQSASKTIGAQFPPEFTYNPKFDVPGCKPDDEKNATCPDNTKLGTIDVTTPFGSASGPVNLMTDLRLVGFLSAYLGAIQERVVGTIFVTDKGGAEVVFDNLPDIPVTSSKIALDGGPKGALVTPRRCGTYNVQAHLVSHDGSVVDKALPVVIDGCPAALTLTGVRLAGRVLHWKTSEPARTNVTLLIRNRRDNEWGEATSGHTNATTLRLPGLPAGTYEAVLRAVTADGRASPARTLRFRIGR